MKISKDVKKAVKNNERYYIDYNINNKQFEVFTVNLNGKSVGDFIKEGFNDTKNIVSKKKDSLRFIYRNEKEADTAAKELNDKIKSEELYIFKCSDCGKYFYMEKEEIDWYNENNFQLPKRCIVCRIKRKKESGKKKEK